MNKKSWNVVNRDKDINKFKPGDLCGIDDAEPIAIFLKTYIVPVYDIDRTNRATAWNFKIGRIIDISQRLWGQI